MVAWDKDNIALLCGEKNHLDKIDFFDNTINTVEFSLFFNNIFE